MTTFRANATYVAKLNVPIFKRIDSIYGGYIDTYKSEAPRSLCIAHILRTNPKLATLLTGVMRVDISYADDYAVPAENLTKDIASIYVFCRSLNREALTLYTNNPTLFSTPYADLWKCAYLKIALRPRSFNALWDLVSPRTTPYETILSYVETMRQSIVDWPVRKLRRYVLYDCDFVIQLAGIKGSLNSSGVGVEPIPPEDHFDIIYGDA